MTMTGNRPYDFIPVGKFQAGNKIRVADLTAKPDDEGQVMLFTKPGIWHAWMLYTIGDAPAGLCVYREQDALEFAKVRYKLATLKRPKNWEEDGRVNEASGFAGIYDHKFTTWSETKSAVLRQEFHKTTTRPAVKLLPRGVLVRPDLQGAYQVLTGRGNVNVIIFLAFIDSHPYVEAIKERGVHAAYYGA